VQTILTGILDDEKMETVQKTLMVFFGKQVRIVIEEDDGEKSRRRRNGT
jgi:hypothetical protein